MSPDDLDARVRAGLLSRTEPVDDADVAQALERVLEGSAAARRRRGAGLLLAAAVLAVGAVAGSVVVLDRPRPEPTPVAPALPSGSFERVVDGGGWRGTWSMTLRPARVLDLVAPRGVSPEHAPTDGTSYRLTETSLTIDAFTNGACNEIPPASYSWLRVGDGLLLQAEDEGCDRRRQVFEGLWEERP